MPALLATVVCIVEEGGGMEAKLLLLQVELRRSCSEFSVSTPFALLPNSVYHLLSMVLAGIRNLRNCLDFQLCTFLF